MMRSGTTTTNRILTNNQPADQSSADDTNGNTYSGLADALKLIGKRGATESLEQLNAETRVSAKKTGRKQSSNNNDDDLTDSDDSDDDLGTGDDGHKRERR